MVDFADSPAEAAFRAAVRRFVDDRLPAALRNPDPDAIEQGEEPDEQPPDRRAAITQWRQALVEQGWIAPAWPKQYGGADLSTMEQFILNQTLAERRIPRIGVPDVGSTIMVHGSPELKQRFLPGMVSGDEFWCQGYSEPGSGSDLASLQTRAVRDGDEFVINGQKIWTSGAHRAEWMFGLFRTDPDAPKHRGISYMLLSMKTPGITVRPLEQMTGRKGFNEVFFEDVRVPANNVVGEINRGWYVGATHLDFERSSIGSAVGQQQHLDALRELLRAEERAGSGRSRLGSNPTARGELAERYVETAVAMAFSFRVVSIQARAQVPNYEASMSKVFSTELNQRIGRTAVRLLGQHGALLDGEDGRAPGRGRWPMLYLSSVAGTIAAGSSEIQRNVIATRGLGLPRG